MKNTNLKSKTGIRTIAWTDNQIRLINQAKLPRELEYIHIKDVKALWQAIRKMNVRGAPALGAAAALGVYLGLRGSKAKKFSRFKHELTKVIRYIGSSRPTARNLFWGLERIQGVVFKNKDMAVSGIKKIILQEAKDIIEEDRRACRRIGYYGAKLIRNNERILTICNAGLLATIDYGTALGVIYGAKDSGKHVSVFACETRPMLQGARLTTWELKKKGVDVTLICDSMAATLMQQGKIDKVIAGADRIAANGDSANKIGTYNLAVLSRYHGIPFYIAAPLSTFDLSIKSGKRIKIENRDAAEVTELFFKQPIAPLGVKVFSPAFDVTPAKLISAIITDRGIISPVNKSKIARISR